MKAIRLVLVGIFAILTIVSCVKDELYEAPGDTPEVKESVIKINEVLSTGDPDWIELYNTSDAELDLEGYILSDKSTDWTIPAGVKIASKGFITFDCDGDGVSSPSFKISSGGEMVSLKDADAVLIDQIDVPSFVDYQGLTYARIPDGENTWEVATPTKGSANSNENNPPVITAGEITEFTEIYKIQVSDADGVASVKVVLITEASVQTVDMVLIDGDYQASIPEFTIGTKVEYYIEAKDITGKTAYYPEMGSEEPDSYYVTKGKPLFISVDYEGAQAGNLGDVTFYANVIDNGSVDEVKLYYVLPGQIIDDKTSVVLSLQGDSVYVGSVPGQSAGSIVSYYLRAKNGAGEKTYYPREVAGDFDHDDLTTWPTYLAALPVVNETVNYTEGPLTSLVFPTNPTPSEANLVLEYDASVDGEILEARVYFDVKDAPSYIKKNKVKGEDDPSFTQSGVTIDLANIDGDEGGNTSVSGTTVTFYVRIATANAEYYYGSNGVMYLDNTPGGGTTDDSDAFKEDPSLWNSYLVQ